MSMRQEIDEQPGLFASLLAARPDIAGDAAEWMAGLSFSHVVVVARGTSDNAARFAQYLWGADLGLVVALATPSLFTGYGRPPSLAGSLVVAISQSGESPDLSAVLDEARRQGRPTMAITNRAGSPVAERADMTVDIGAGTEVAVAATKTYTAQLLAISMISHHLRDQTGLGRLRHLSTFAETMIRQEAVVSAAAAGLADMSACAVLGRGYNLSTAHEWSLKVQEISYVPAHPFSTADFRHGPMAMLGPDVPVLAVAPAGAMFEDSMEVLAIARQRGSTTVVVSNHPAALALASFPVELPAAMHESVSPIVAAIGAQLFAYHHGVIKGHDTDRPRGLTKVTRTE